MEYSSYYYLWLLASLLVLVSCKKGEFINLKSTIYSENIAQEIEEGDNLILTFNLTEALSEDLPLEINILRDLESGSYINLEDVENYFSYSTDGETWKRGNGKEVVFPERNKSLKIRLATLDDDQLEAHEKFSLEIIPKTGNLFDIRGDVEAVKVTVFDNEFNQYAGGAGEDALVFILSENNQYQLVGINRNAIINKVMKRYIDQGPDQEFLNDIDVLVKAGGIPIHRISLVYDPDISWLGYVFNNGFGRDEWTVGLNLTEAYTEANGNDYNSNGKFGYVLVHEYGHVMTLNSKYEVETPYSGFEENTCNTVLTYSEGCFYKNSILNRFNESFYHNETQYNDPHFVTQYASTNITEDIAETFTYYIGQKIINAVGEQSSGALRKINYVANHPRLKDLKAPIVQGLSNSNIITEDNFIRQFNQDNQEKWVACTDYKAIKKLTELAHKKRKNPKRKTSYD